MEQIKIWLKMLLYERCCLSLNRMIAVSGWIAFLLVSLYLALTGSRMDNYDTFCMWAGGGGAGTALAHQTIHSICNSPKGQMPEMGNVEGEKK